MGCEAASGWDAGGWERWYPPRKEIARLDCQAGESCMERIESQ